ncbi:MULTISPECIES: methyl-accepting chemotaxis protein [unclassified Pseudomonas]|jgi:methyl-accepting chemotaxis protein|uniref:Methyl-accepting chemotaxis protein n=1 Tax=Pseudomonas gorinensis TaxID=3240790 RepID=A0ACA7P5M2_9PSED|nr:MULTISPECIES: methyl-accepting chemotaxis protein [unclassified Pseudomonas]AHC35315.1 methyl-accepting chemotaxis protein [Pseudomonas sp. TKP]MBL1307389.1 methyl-accepting chemotaxis protein [Pseudomonas sp.]PMX07716.1 methyl-accepting chemotaxis protein [Pseudomonas sp. MPBC4-3]PMX42293.1 methyl-accepting chemotaxis protein [Pseudomonas sp. FW301-21B01]PMY01702.1 methyl-accepting chemotaxis protein [Pseudomonas sp. MPR-R5A]
MKQLTTAQRIVIGFAIAPLALVGLVFYALHDLATLKQQSEHIVQQDWPRIAPIMVIATGVRDNGRNTRDLLIDQDNQQAQASIGTTRERITQAFATLEPLLDTAEGKAAYATLKSHREAYVAAFTQVQALIKQGAREQGLAQLKQQVMPAELDVFKSLDALMAMQGRLFTEREQAAQTLYDDARRTMIGLFLLCLTLVVAAAVIVTRSVTRPLGGEPDEVARVLKHIANGDLTIEVPLGNSADGSVMRNLHLMQQSLNQMVRHIAVSVDGVASSSEELSAVSSQTSSSLQLQGQEIEQAATAVNEMTAAVDEVARNAVSTSEASHLSEQTAQRGQAQVQETVASINTLATGVVETSERIQQLAGRVQDISGVLEVIRSIADQTNLLALNAAIEAARAGDAGRGFAVVADEVRALAHRTQSSTQEIEQMIGNIRQDTEHAVAAMHSSSERVQATLGVAQRSGEALAEITRSISQINERNLMIASATEEQALVAREVDRNLVGIRNLSQQVLQGALHTETAGHDLAGMAGALHQTVARFKV